MKSKYGYKEPIKKPLRLKIFWTMKYKQTGTTDAPVLAVLLIGFHATS